jgi:hypothetical protein
LLSQRLTYVKYLSSAVTGLAVASLHELYQRVFSSSILFVTTHLLLDLKTINDWCELAEDLVGFLVEFKLGSDEISQVAEWLRGIENLFELISIVFTSQYTTIGEYIRSSSRQRPLRSGQQTRPQPAQSPL